MSALEEDTGTEEDAVAAAASAGRQGLSGEVMRRAKAAHKNARQRMRAMKKTQSVRKFIKRGSGLGGPYSVAKSSVALSGCMYKKRSGMTGFAASFFHQADNWTERKLGGRLWMLRFFVLKNGVLYYYDLPKNLREFDGDDRESAEEEFSPEEGSERGSIDLVRNGVQLRLSFAQSSLVVTPTQKDKEREKEEVFATGIAASGSPQQGPIPQRNSMPSSLASRQIIESALLNKQAAMNNIPLVSGNSGSPSNATQGSGASSFSFSDGSKSPSPFQFEIVYNSVMNPKEWQSWTMCTGDKKTLFKWVSALSSVIYGQRSTTSEEDWEEFDEAVQDFCEDSSDLQRTTSGESFEILSPPLPSSISAHKDINDHGNEVKVISADESVFMTETLFRLEGDGYFIHIANSLIATVEENRLELGIALCFSNLVLLSVYEFRPMVAIFVLTLAQLLVIWKLQQNVAGTLVTSRRKRNRRMAFDQKRSARRAGLNGGASSAATGVSENDDEENTGDQGASTSRKGGTGIPFVERSVLESEEGNDLVHVWTHADDSLLKMRTGPNYKLNKLKASTKPSLYHTIGVDLFESQKKLMDVAGRLQPPLDLCVEANRLPEGFPRLLVFNFQLPMPGGTMLTSADGKGYNFVVYLTPTEDLVQMLSHLEEGKPVEAAVPLLVRWLNESETDMSIKERLKLVGFVLNPAECGMPSWVQSFNGKPVLIKKSGVISRHPGIFEVDMDLRMWGFMTRKGISALLPSALAKMEFIVSFVIQGEEDDELPERSLSATHFAYLRRERAEKLY